MRECKWKASIKRTYLTFWKGIHGQQIQYNITWGYMAGPYFFFSVYLQTVHCTVHVLLNNQNTLYLPIISFMQIYQRLALQAQTYFTFLLNNIQKEQLFLKSTIQGLIDNLFIWSTIFSTWWLLYVTSYYWKHHIAICFH